MKGLFIALLACAALPAGAQSFVDSLLSRMTLEEKIGQMNQYNGDWEATGPVTKDVGDKLDEIRQGKVGAVLNIMGTVHVRTFQDAALQSRLKIPLLFGQDVIHGYRITFPIPLGEAASWDLEAIGHAERIAATEAAASGINWTFAPMVDIARDPRWGRVMEGAGEDPYLGSLIAAARVKGFQGARIGDTTSVMACAKHFAAYGAAIGGRDYNSVDMSLWNLWSVYLPPFKAAVDAGVSTVMNSFNSLNGTPATASAYLQRDILKGKWGFGGFVVSDWNSIGEMINQGFARDNSQASELALKAGNDMDMESRSYIHSLAALVASGKVSESLIDSATRRILLKKYQLGLFDDPYKFINPAREKSALNRPENLEAARDMARRSMVLLKNSGGLLPLSPGAGTVALIGPLSKAKKELKGFWALDVDPNEDIPSLYDGMQAAGARVSYARGCGINDSLRTGFAEAVAAASKAGVVVMAMGEAPDMTGEAKSKANIHLPGVQEDLIKAIVATGKPVVVVLFAGRPLVFNWTADHVPAILYAWWPGSEGGNAIADVLYGKYNPSGKLPITFPRAEGQVPIYYAHFNTGRPPANDSDRWYTSSYLDLPVSPRYAFGYGLSYTTFGYSDFSFDSSSLTATFTLSNTGHTAGEEVVQMYLRCMTSQPVSPVKELKDFRKVFLQPGESRRISLTITPEKLSYYNDQLEWVRRTGTFQVMIGSASDDIRFSTSFVAPDDLYACREVMIPMRDGVKLHTVICTPKKSNGLLPFLMTRTPYGIGSGQSPEKSDYTKELAEDGYIFVYQDIRGRYQSEGTFEMTRMPRDRNNPRSVDEASDTYDSMDWLLKNVPGNNGKCGIYGISYDGWLSIIAASDPHPALAAVSEQATPSDMFLNDDFHHNGAFRLSYGFEYAILTEAAKTDSLYNFHEYDTYNWYLRLGPLSNLNRLYAHGTLPTWNNFIAHPNYDAFWKRQALLNRLDYPRVPIQHVGGWWDEEDMVGPQDAYAYLEKRDSSHRNFLVIGPWLHGQWANGDGSSLANIKFDGQKTGRYFRSNIQARWFAHYLKGAPGDFAEAITFQTGSNQWREYSAWPPREAVTRRIYLQSAGGLSFTAPPASGGFTSYVSDPSKPVPYRPRPVEETYGPNSHWYFWLTFSQRFVDNRQDVVSWETDTLSDDLTVTGNVVARLFASTSGTDADWVVKLIDVYPDVYPKELGMSGYELMINAEIVRARYRNGFSTPLPLVPGKVEEYKINLHGADHVFKRGHRIMVQIQSTWFPVYDRNPQKFVPNIYEASAGDYHSATQKVFHSATFASCIELPVMQKQ